MRIVYRAKASKVRNFPQVHVSLDGGSFFSSHCGHGMSVVFSASWQPPVRPSVVCQQYPPPNPLGGISPIFTGLIAPFQSCSKISTLCRNLVVMATKMKHSKILSKNFWSDFKVIWYKGSLGYPLTKLFNLF